MLGTFLIYSIFKARSFALSTGYCSIEYTKKALSYSATECLDTVPENNTHALDNYVNEYSLNWKNSVTVPVHE